MADSFITVLNESADVAICNSNIEIINLDDDANHEEGEVDDDDDIIDNLLFEVKFKHNAFFHRYSTILAKTLEKVCAEQKDAIKCNIFEANLSIAAYAATTDDSSNIELNATTKEQSPDLTGIKELFTIDASPSVTLESMNVPSYKRNIKNVLDETTLADKKPKLENICERPRPACFNCGDKNHSLRDCSERRDMRRINSARKSFVRGPDNRYHVNNQQFPNKRPGVISDELRKLLGLRNGELPSFFYRMRLYGYPPGWLKDALVKSSGLSVIDANGAKESLESESLAAETNKYQYDVSKIIDFPGFNAQPNGKFYDDYKYYNVPPMQEHQFKENFIKHLGSNVINGYKLKKLNKLPQGTKDDFDTVPAASCIETIDMEIEDDDQVQLPAAYNATINLSDSDTNNETVTIRTPSPSLADLEAQQNALLQALESATTATATNTIEKTQKELKETETSVSMVESTILPNSRTIKEEPLTLEMKESTTPQMEEPTTPVIKESHMGTPILKFSPFNNLPSGDNFRVGVSDVINFENLPDSTGKYEQMKVVIRKVRNIVTQIKEKNNM